MDIQDRIIQFLDYKGITKYKFYKDLEFSNGFLDKKGNMGIDKCEKIYSKYPEINLEWLITGKGQMIKSNSNPKYLNKVAFIHDNIDDGNDFVETKNQIIEILKDELKEKNKQISELTEALKNISKKVNINTE